MDSNLMSPSAVSLLGERMDDKSDTAFMEELAKESKRRFDQKISDGIYKYEKCACFCGESDDQLLSTRDIYGNYFPLVICKKCGLIRANPRLTKESYVDFYSFEYRNLYNDNDPGKDQIYPMRIKQGQAVFEQIQRHLALPDQAVVFDVGCNMGTMLLPFHQRGCRVMGVDYGQEHIKYGREKTGLILEIGGAEKLKEFGERADLIILSHVFEHFIGLDEELSKINDVIKPEGYLYISVPGTFWWIKNICAGNIKGVIQNAHTWQFSLATLKYVMECSGYRLVYGDEKITAIFKRDIEHIRSRNNVPENEFKRTVKYLLNLEKKWLKRRKMVGIIEKLGLKELIRKLMGKRSKSQAKIESIYRDDHQKGDL